MSRQGMDVASKTSTLTPAAPPEGWQQVAGYDWRTLDVPSIGLWQPTRTASVVIPAFDCQEKLDLTLAALTLQRYPSSLMEIVIADDGSAVPLRVPELAPENTRIIHLDRRQEWGRARACHEGALAADGEILLFLDADMVAYPDHLVAHARWHHVVQDAVTLGHKLFVNDFSGISPEEVAQAAAQDQLFALLSHRPHQEHDWVEQLIVRTDNLTSYDPRMFQAAVGATVGMRADMYRETGGFRTNLRGGEDMELAYRLMAAGAVFIPERQARSWHLGPATYMSRADEVRRTNQPHFANYVPVPGAFRPWTPGRQYAVPMVDVIVTASGASFEATKHSVDALLGSDHEDLRIDVVCAVAGEDDALLHAQYEGDPRVHVRTDMPPSGFPSRFTLFLPDFAGVAPETVHLLVELIEQAQVGVLRVVIPGVEPDDGSVWLWRTGALHRARRAAADGQDLAAVGTNLFGERLVDGAQVGVVDLRSATMVELPLRQPSTSVLLRRLNQTQKELKRVRRRYRHLRARHDALATARTWRVIERLARRLTLPVR